MGPEGVGAKPEIPRCEVARLPVSLPLPLALPRGGMVAIFAWFEHVIFSSRRRRMSASVPAPPSYPHASLSTSVLV